MGILITSLKIIIALIIVLAASGAVYQYIATKLDERNYPPIGKMIDIGGYKLHMVDRGNGGPTVIMDAGSGCTTLDWSLVQPEIAKFTRVITYDRAGYAWSDASPLQRTSENIVQELHTMLYNANIPAPYILVGHSFGGLNMQLFASMYHDEVVGIVLVDSSSQESYEQLQHIKPSTFSTFIQQMSLCLGIARLMLYRPSIKIILNKMIEKYPLNVQKSYFSQKLTLKFHKAMQQEGSFVEQNNNQLKHAQGLGNKPLTVISAGKSMMGDEFKGRVSQEHIDLVNKTWPEMQVNLVTKSTRGKQIIAKKSGHLINYDQPEIIVTAVREMVDELRN